VISASIVFLLCFFFAPQWASNDDVGLSMVAHGYGVSSVSSPNLFFSNILWGYLVRAIPTINGILGYSIATLSVLIIVGAVVIYALYQFGVNSAVCLSIFALMLVRPVLFPQFTINAGLLMVAAVTCWHLYTQQSSKQVLLFGCLLAFCSYLVRSQEFLLVFFIALPLLSWHILFADRFAKIVFLVLIISIAISAIIDYQAYQVPEWKTFNDLKPVFSPIVDFGAGAHLIQHPDILQRHGYSNNDINLIAGWFLVDQNIANPKALQSMLTELGYLPTQGNSLTKAWFGIQGLWHQDLLPLTLSALLLLVLRPSWQLGTSWIFCIVAVFTMGLLGRPAILRVYIPLVCLLLIAPFFRHRLSIWRNQLETYAILLVAILNTAQVFSESNTAQAATIQAHKDFANFPHDTVVVWGDQFPFEINYPVLGASSSVMAFKLHSLGGFTWAPSTRSFIDQKQGRSLINRLVEEAGVPIIAHEVLFKYLETYCKERLHGQLKELSSTRYGKITVSQRQCEIKPMAEKNSANTGEVTK
jgi:hypothetical protein